MNHQSHTGLLGQPAPLPATGQPATVVRTISLPAPQDERNVRPAGSRRRAPGGYRTARRSSLHPPVPARPIPPSSPTATYVSTCTTPSSTHSKSPAQPTKPRPVANSIRRPPAWLDRKMAAVSADPQDPTRSPARQRPAQLDRRVRRVSDLRAEGCAQARSDGTHIPDAPSIQTGVAPIGARRALARSGQRPGDTHPGNIASSPLLVPPAQQAASRGRRRAGGG